MASKFNLAASIQPSEMTKALLVAIAGSEAPNGEPFVEYDDMGNKCVSLVIERNGIEMTQDAYRMASHKAMALADATFGSAV